MLNRKIIPKFIVLEGLDGAGTTTQSDLLVGRSASAGKLCRRTCEPTSGPVGTVIRTYLSGSVPVHPDTLALLFAADRAQHVHGAPDGILLWIESGATVVCDRYLFSSLAYQSIGSGFEYVRALNERFPLPEHLFFLDVPPEVCVERLASRRSREIFEEITFLRRVREAYLRTIESFGGSGIGIHVIDGTAAPDAIASVIWSRIENMPIQGA